MFFEKTKKISGFTLAEVLITLSVIGVVAAITIPSVMNRSSTLQYISALKKFHNTMQRISNSAIMEGKHLQNWGWSKSDDNAEDIFKNYIEKRLRVVRYCGVATGQGCGSEYLGLDGKPAGNWDNDSTVKVAIVDGATMAFSVVGNCEEIDENVVEMCGEVMVDINGTIKPNKVGRDIFWFGYYSNGLFMPYNYEKTEEEIEAGCRAGADGKTCAAKIVKDGWIFKSDGSNKYPW